MSTIGSLNVDGSTLDASLLGVIFTMARHHHDDHSNLLHGDFFEFHPQKIVASEGLWGSNKKIHRRYLKLYSFFPPQH